jgi:hypothetical protein
MMLGMVWNLNAAKAYVGGIAATSGPAVGGFINKLLESVSGINFPDQVDLLIVGGVTYVITHLAVYITSNSSATP